MLIMIVHHVYESIFVTRHKDQSQQVFLLEIDARVSFSGYTADMHTRQLGFSSSARLENTTTLPIHVDPLYSYLITHSPLEHKRHNHLYTIRRLSFILALSPIIILARHYSVPIIQSRITADRAITLTQLCLSYNTTKTTQWHDWSVTVCVSSTPYQPRHRPIYVNCFTALLLYTPLSRLPKATSRATVSLLYRCFLSLSSRMTSVEGGD
jgi:hypothetical protein